jgi:hypothetical protein
MGLQIALPDPTPHLTRRRILVLGGRRHGKIGLSTLRGVGGGRYQGRYARASPIPYPQPWLSPSPHPTDTNSNYIVVHTDRKTEDTYM